MAKARKKHVGAGTHGKGDGSGGMTSEAGVPENIVLSNRERRARSGRQMDPGRAGSRFRSQSEQAVRAMPGARAVKALTKGEQP